MRFLFEPTSLIAALVEYLLPRHSPLSQVLVVNLELEVTNRYGWKTEVRRVHLVFHRPGNYTKVLWLISDWRGNPPRGEALEFKLESYHDSCWRDDGISSPLFQLTRELEDLVSDKENDIERIVKFDISNPFSLLVVREMAESADQKKYAITF